MKVRGFTLDIPAGGKRKKPSVCLDPIAGYICSPDTRVTSDDESALIKEIFAMFEAGERFFGVALIDHDLRYLTFRAASHGIEVPSIVKTAISARACSEESQFLDFSRLCSLPPGNIDSQDLSLAVMKKRGSPIDEVCIFASLAATLGLTTQGIKYVSKDPFRVDIPKQSFPRINTHRLPKKHGDIAVFQWMIKPIASLSATGPGGQGWGRATLAAALKLPMNPAAFRICGFTAVINGEITSFVSENEVEAMTRGIGWVESSRKSARVFVNQPALWRKFSAVRAMACGATVPICLFGDEGKRWLRDFAAAGPAYSSEFASELLRYCIEKTAILTAGEQMELDCPLWQGLPLDEENLLSYVWSVAGFIAASPFITQETESPL